MFLGPNRVKYVAYPEKKQSRDYQLVECCALWGEQSEPFSDKASFPLYALILQCDAPFFDEAYFLMLLLILK